MWKLKVFKKLFQKYSGNDFYQSWSSGSCTQNKYCTDRSREYKTNHANRRFWLSVIHSELLTCYYNDNCLLKKRKRVIYKVWHPSDISNVSLCNDRFFFLSITCSAGCSSLWTRAKRGFQGNKHAEPRGYRRDEVFVLMYPSEGAVQNLCILTDHMQYTMPRTVCCFRTHSFLR